MRSRTHALLIVAAPLVAVLFAAAACAPQPHDASSQSDFHLSDIASTVSERADEAAVQLEEQKREQAERALRERREREERERAEEAARVEQQRLEAWQARFPVGDYSDVLLIGDSLMQNASAALTAAMPGASVNADAGRTLEAGGLVFEDQRPDKGILDHVRADDGTHQRYVIGAGNNDYAGMPLEAAEEIVNRLGQAKEIYFITEIVVGNPQGTAATNASIAAVVERHPNAHAVAWHDLVAGHERDYLSDGCHVLRAREPDYAACIKQALDTPA